MVCCRQIRGVALQQRFARPRKRMQKLFLVQCLPASPKKSVAAAERTVHGLPLHVDFLVAAEWLAL